MASSSSITLLNSSKLLKLSPPVPRSLSLHSSTTPTNVFNGGDDASKKFNGIFSKPGLFPYQATPLINNNPFVARSVHTTTPTIYPGPYPLQDTAEPRKPYEVKLMTEGLFARVDMPGVGEGEAEVFVKDNTVVFKGEARKEAEIHKYDIPRAYMGSFNLFFDPDLTRNIRTEVKNGVLRFVVPAMVKDDTCFSDYPSPPSTLIFTEPLPHSSEDGNENPFQCGGIKGSYEMFAGVGDVMCLRVDLPGVEQDTMNVFFDEDKTTMYYRGEAPEEWEEFDQDGRSYFGSLSLRCGCCNISEVGANVTNGVFRAMVSKVKLS